MKEYIIGLGISIAFTLIVYVIILLIKAISRGISSRSKETSHSHRPIAITIVGVLGILASLLTLGLGLFAVFHWGFDTDTIIFVCIPILVGVLGLLCSVALFLMKRIAAVTQLVILALYNLAGIYNAFITENFLPSIVGVVISLIFAWILLKYLPDMD